MNDVRVSTRDAHVVLSDGRKLGYAEFGDLEGTPLLWFPGLPGCCRHALPGDAELTRHCGVRLIVVERPGFGISDFKPGRRLLDYPKDVVELADALGIGRFCIAGDEGLGQEAQRIRLTCRIELARHIRRLARFT